MESYYATEYTRSRATEQWNLTGMKIFIIFFALLAPIALTSVQSESTNTLENKYDEKKNKIVKEAQAVHTSVSYGYTLVSKQTALSVKRYTSYNSMTIIIYRMPEDVSDARFTFQTENVQLNSIGSCEIQDFVIDLKRGAFPAVNPDGYPFPENYIDPALRAEPIHTIEFQAEKYSSIVRDIRSPRPGNWYALVYVKWRDPLLSAVKQEGLTADCYTVFYTDLQVKKNNNITAFDCYSGLTLKYSDLPNYYKCITTSNPGLTPFNITVTDAATGSEPVLVSINTLNIPTDEENILQCSFDPVISSMQSITFVPNPNSWHYIHVTKIKNTTNYVDCQSYTARIEYEGVENYTTTDLMKENKGRFFRYDFGLPHTNDTDFKTDVTSLVKVSSETVTTLKFPLTDFLDVGGNLMIEMGLLMNPKYYSGYERPLKSGAKYAFTESDQFFKVVVCVSINHVSLPLKSGNCQYNDRVQPAFAVLNSTDSTTIHDRMTIPYPESGTWYISMRVFCDEIVCPCPTSHNGTKYYIQSNSIGNEEDLSGEITNSTWQGISRCNATVVLAVESNKCIYARCHHEGQCLLHSFNGLTLTFCKCSYGFGGWDCSDTSRLEPMGILLLRTLLLTLSNLLFFVSIYVATIRQYYTEAVMYGFTMSASTFYHACDSHIFVRMCLLENETLQYIDFYCGNLAFWISLLAMSILYDFLRPVLQLSGAILISVLIMWDMHSLSTFLIPQGIGIAILLGSWALDYYRHRRMKYPRSYYTKHFPIGLLLVSVGLICYAFLQTAENYHYIHSLWHAIIAGSVSFLLPDRRENVHPFLPTPNSCKWKNIREKFRLKPIYNNGLLPLPSTDSNLLPTTAAATGDPLQQEFVTKGNPVVGT